MLNMLNFQSITRFLKNKMNIHDSVMGPIVVPLLSPQRVSCPVDDDDELLWATLNNHRNLDAVQAGYTLLFLFASNGTQTDTLLLVLAVRYPPTNTSLRTPGRHSS